MGTINKVFLYNGTPMNGATAQLWKITAFASYADSTKTVQDNPLELWMVECLTSGAVFAVGDVVKIEDECCLVWKTSGNTIYIIRGWHGTDPAQHNQNEKIYDETITPPVVDDAVPGAGQQGGNITTGVAYGGDGAYRFDDVPEMEYYASVTYDTHITYVHCFVERNDITPEQILTKDGDLLIRNADTVTRLPGGRMGYYLMQGVNRPVWSLAGITTFTELAGGEDHNVAGAVGWEDWDLSAIIPAGQKIVLVGIRSELTSNTSGENGAREKGSGLARLFTVKAAATTGGDLIQYNTILTKTDANRVIEIYGFSTTKAEFNIIGYWS